MGSFANFRLIVKTFKKIKKMHKILFSNASLEPYHLLNVKKTKII